MQFRDLQAQYQHMKSEIDTVISHIINSSSFILGKEVVELEAKLAEYVGVKHCITCANGTDALQLVLMAWGVGPGDAVFTSDFTFFASAGTASIVGASPVFVDIDQDTFNICPDDLEDKIRKVREAGKLKPRVIVPVDLFGQPADYDRILPIARKYGLLVLEDGAQGFGGNIRGQRVCSFGDAATTSFFPAKPLGCYGDGGAIFTNYTELNTILQSLRTQGRSPEDKYDNRVIGMNSRLDTLQAAILLPKLKAFREYELDTINKAAWWYNKHLEGIVKTPTVTEGYLSSWAQYTIRLKDEEQRDGLRKHLAKHGIPSVVNYPRGLHQQIAYLEMDLQDDDYPNTVAATKQVLSLPMHPYMKERDCEKVALSIADYLDIEL